MNKKITPLIITTAFFFAFSCRQTAPKVTENTRVISKTSVGLASVSALAQPLHSVQSLQNKSHYKKRSCCVGTPSRFKANVLVTENEVK
ncbi:hypothetical protein [Segetibacter aerophilus]|uniref:Uncharacterized protein n=1 Tax=Segetibacter aerophilus TaxID=670293 RepID=A0A512BES6_9BACT|nr:hypothetical protein [Segetibacter aerophilus]GEO10473.1 hypothetical protein SAE01_29690 [Segetibacter aerophilus]